MNSDTAGQADYSYWLKVRIWDSREAAALLLGYEPDYAYGYGPDELGSVENKIDPLRSAIRDKANKLETILERAQLAGEFGKVRLNQGGGVWGGTVSPFDWMAWAKSNNIDCVEALLNAVAETKEQDDSEADDIHPRRETTLLRVIGALLQELKESTDQSQANIIKRIDDQHGHKSGISKSQLENDFAEANRRLKDW